MFLSKSSRIPIKILYASGPWLGSGLTINRFIKSSNHEIRVAAHYNKYLNKIHWLLNSIYKYHRQSFWDVEQFSRTARGIKNLHTFCNDIKEWGPDLIINDLEPASLYVAEKLDIPIWSCSMFNLPKTVKKNVSIPEQINSLRILRKKPYDKVLSNSFIGMLHKKDRHPNVIKISPNIEPISTNITDGENDIITDMLCAGINPIVKGNYKYFDSLYNSIIIDSLGIGAVFNEELDESELRFKPIKLVQQPTLSEFIDANRP